MSLRTFVRKLLPTPLLQTARALAWSTVDARYRLRTGKSGFPPAYLRVKVYGKIPVEAYLKSQESWSQALLAALKRVGADPAQFKDVLDFGCGCGRVLLPLKKHLPQARFSGTDTDAEQIAWSQKHIADVSFACNSPEPPLPYADASFDLIYGCSVFTHLDERLQFLWLDELKRVARPGAILILTVHALDRAAAETQGAASAEGFRFVNDGAWADFFPDFYQTTYHSRPYLEAVWGRYFTVLDYDESRIGELRQAVVVLRRD